MSWTKEQVGRMTSEEYKSLYGNLKAGLSPEQEAFRTFVDGAAPAVNVRDGAAAKPPLDHRASPRARSEASQVVTSPATTDFDPSFDDDPNKTVAPLYAVIETVPAVIEPALIPAVVPPVELPELRHEYDIADKKGRKIGGRQVFKYRTDANLIEQLTKSNISLRVMIQEIREKQLLEGTEAPAEATVAQPLQLRPRLSEDERKDWKIKLLDPATAAQAQYHLDRDDDRAVQNDLLVGNLESRIMLALESFKNRNRDYVPSQENAVKLVGYIERRNLDPTDARNYQRAYDVLRENGSIDDASGNQATEPVLVQVPPTVREEKTVPNAAPVEVPARISESTPPPARPVAAIPTGLSSTDQISDTANALPAPHWLTIRVWLKDSKGNPTSQFQEFHDLDAINHSDDKFLKRLISDQSAKGRELRSKWDKAEEEKNKNTHWTR